MVVVMDIDHYYRLTSKHLADLSTYKLLESDHSEHIVMDFHGFINHCVANKVPDKFQYRSPHILDDYQMQTIYFLPKVHKHSLVVVFINAPLIRN